MRKKTKFISLKEVFASINHAPKSVIAEHTVDPVLTYDHAVAIVKRFAADDAEIYNVFVGKKHSPVLSDCFNDRNDPLAQHYYSSIVDYMHLYEQSAPAPVFNHDTTPGDLDAPEVKLDKTNTLVLDQGSGYENTYHLIRLIKEALECRRFLSPTFPRITDFAKPRVADLVKALDRTNLSRFVIFEDEAEALKNLVLPSNPLDQRLSCKLSKLIDIYEEEFEYQSKRLPPPAPRFDTVIG